MSVAHEPMAPGELVRMVLPRNSWTLLIAGWLNSVKGSRFTTPATATMPLIGLGSDPTNAVEHWVAAAKRLESVGAVMLNFFRSGPIAGPAVVQAVSIPVLGGFGGGPWLDGRMRMAHAAIGYAASGVDDPPDTYANVARISFDALTAYAEDVRAGRQIKGQ